MFGNANYKQIDADFPGLTEAYLIDIRSNGEVRGGGIAGAVHIEMHLLPLRAADIPKDKPVVLYCHSGARSAQACTYLAQQGFDNMHNLSGGILAWARAGKPIVAIL
ncbi:MAG: rhodanese-like domain-containing protein [Betaproteobacteria bacterium]|nr:MAG: rhodanese-like domain-containing protein [Betaproteobacteria bacterium]